MSDLPHNITITKPNYFPFIHNRSLGKSSHVSPHIVNPGNKWYLIMSQIYTSLYKQTLTWYDGSYSPDPEEKKILVRCERFLQHSPRIETVSEAVERGYKNVVVYCLQRDADKLRQKIEQLEAEFGSERTASREILRYMETNIQTVQQM